MKILNWSDPQWALITGASAGIGAAFANRLAEEGFNIAIVARRRQKMESVAEKIRSLGVQTELIEADLATQAGVDKVIEFIIQNNKIDILVNNAGFGTKGDFIEADFSNQLNMIQVHNIVPVQLMKAALPQMVQRKKGAIINVASLQSFMAAPGSAMYSATKGFLRFFSESVAIELDGTGVKIQALCPGFTKTEFHEVGELQEFDRSVIPNFLWMTVEEVIQKSLLGLMKNKTVIVPGFKNRLLKWLMTSSLTSGLAKKTLRKKKDKAM